LEQGRCGFDGQGKVAELVDLCGYPDRSTYADTATMPRWVLVGCRLRGGAGFLGVGV
jgi:hypothetical protein